jgi:hypothetical protein
MAKDLRIQPVRPGARTPGKRWGEGLASILEVLGTGHNTVEEGQQSDFEDTERMRNKAANRVGDSRTG